MSYYFAWQPYVSVAEKRRRAEREVAQAEETGQAITPVRIEAVRLPRVFGASRGAPTSKRYSDFENRLPRGRTYVRNVPLSTCKSPRRGRSDGRRLRSL